MPDHDQTSHTQTSESPGWHSIHALSERILQANSATEELERWCWERKLADGRIVAIRARSAKAEPLDDDSLEAVRPYGRTVKTEFRRVQLAMDGIILVDALNWYFPAHLTRDICEALNSTNIPFGRAIKSLRPKRRTFLVKRCTPEQFAASRDPAGTAFEHHAVVLREDSTPLAVVHEGFRSALVKRPSRLKSMAAPPQPQTTFAKGRACA